ncbi:MAG: 1-acyl-sn-glycerol-3-phosphate acyltransferase [Actinomycetales bacterium]|nr:1-acyl-sn-glycerol-3-phosphate acyltransferase [Actinomycetales bacterium]
MTTASSGSPSLGQRVTAADIKRWGPVWSRRVGWFLDHVWWNTTVLGAENVPRTGPVIVASNHIGVVDGPVLHGAIPRASHIIVKQEFFDSKLGFLMDWAGQIPVDRSSGRAALVVARDLLQEGRLVGIFPEGARGTGDVQGVKAGVAWLAAQTGAPVVPAACLGTRPRGASVGHVPRPRARLWVVFGEPLVLPTDLPRGKAGTQEAIRLVSEHMARHVEAAVARTGVALPGDAGRRD